MECKFDIGDEVEVVKWGGMYSPEIGNTGKVVSTVNDYPIIKFKDREPIVEDLNGLCTVDPDVLKKIKRNYE